MKASVRSCKTADARQPESDKNHQAWSIWHNFYLSPYHVVAVEMFAKAFYPDLFADINPQQTFKQLYQQFLPLPFSGTYWSQLQNE